MRCEILTRGGTSSYSSSRCGFSRRAQSSFSRFLGWSVNKTCVRRWRSRVEDDDACTTEALLSSQNARDTQNGIPQRAGSTQARTAAAAAAAAACRLPSRASFIVVH